MTCVYIVHIYLQTKWYIVNTPSAFGLRTHSILHPARPYPQDRLAQMQDFQGDGAVTLDTFSDQVDQLFMFYHWNEQETCRHRSSSSEGYHAGLCTTHTLPTVQMGGAEGSSHEVFPTAESHGHIQSPVQAHHRCQTEDIYTSVEAHQHLDD